MCWPGTTWKMPSAVADRSCAFLTPQQGAEGTFLLSTLSQQVVPEEPPSLWQPLCARFWSGAQHNRAWMTTGALRLSYHTNK